MLHGHWLKSQWMRDLSRDTFTFLVKSSQLTDTLKLFQVQTCEDASKCSVTLCSSWRTCQRVRSSDPQVVNVRPKCWDLNPKNHPMNLYFKTLHLCTDTVFKFNKQFKNTHVKSLLWDFIYCWAGLSLRCIHVMGQRLPLSLSWGVAFLLFSHSGKTRHSVKICRISITCHYSAKPLERDSCSSVWHLSCIL